MEPVRCKSSTALLGLSLGSIAVAAELVGVNSTGVFQANWAEYKKGSPTVDFTSIDLLTAQAFGQRQDWRGEPVSLHPDVLLPIPAAWKRVKIDAQGLRLERIYRIRHQPEKVALVLTNVGRPLSSMLLVVTLSGPGSARTLYGVMPGFAPGASRRLLLSASIPIANHRMTIQLRPWRRLSQRTVGKEDGS